MLLSEEQKVLLSQMNEVGHTDSDLVYFCEENMINVKEAYRYMAELNAPQQCKGCKHIEMFGVFCGMYPCSVCSRLNKDMYEKEGDDIKAGDENGHHD